MSSNNKNTHLTLEERRIINTGVTNASTKVAIAKILGKDKSTIGKEIKAHRELIYKCKMPLECSGYKKCKYGRLCKIDCIGYKPFKCSRRDRSPGCCNGCEYYTKCRFNKYRYSPEKADYQYREQLVYARSGVDLSYNQAKEIAYIMKPLLNQGQSIYMIKHNHPEISRCAKTLYNDIDNLVYSEFEINNIDLRRRVKFKMSKKKKAVYKKRKDNKYISGRTYEDYLNYIKENPNTSIVQMDTVYNNQSGPFLQTFKFINYGYLLAIYHEDKTAQSMLDGVDLLESILGRELFTKECSVILTDRGSEFSKAEEMEMVGEFRRTRVYYCDPMQSCQKGSVENKHHEIRYILPKECDFKKSGLTNQAKTNLMLSHINSSPLKSLNGKTSNNTMGFFNYEMQRKFNDFGIIDIEKDKVTLKPYLLKNQTNN